MSAPWRCVKCCSGGGFSQTRATAQPVNAGGNRTGGGPAHQTASEGNKRGGEEVGLYDPLEDLTPEKPTPAPAPAPAPRLRPALFQMGQIVATPGAIETMNRNGVNPAELLYRHVSGDWGDLDADDKRLNDLAVQQSQRILSCYGTGPDRLWCVTEYDRSVTTILRPDEY